MSDQEAKQNESQSPEDLAPEETLSIEDAVDQDEAVDDEPALTELELLRQERDELESKYLRTAADFQNYVRRASSNVESAREQAILDVVRKLVGTLDTFDRAMSVAPEKSSVQDVLSGVGLVRDELMKTLESVGVERIEAEAGEAFDPSRHEALMRTPSEEYESNHVVEQYQPGYAVGGKTIRGAQVSVSA